MSEGSELCTAKANGANPEVRPVQLQPPLAVAATVLATAATTMLVATVEALMVELTLCAVEIVSVEVLKVIVRLTVSAMIGVPAVIPIPGIEVMIYGAIVAGAAAIPGACTDKEAAVEPLRAVVAIGRAVIGRKAIVAIRANRSGATDVYTERNLAAGRRWSGCAQRYNSSRGK